MPEAPVETPEAPASAASASEKPAAPVVEIPERLAAPAEAAVAAEPKEALAETPPDYKALAEQHKAEFEKEKAGREAAEKRASEAEHLVRTQAGTQSATDRRLNNIERHFARRDEVEEAAKIGEEQVALVKDRHKRDDLRGFGVEIGKVMTESGLDVQKDWETRDEFENARDAWFSGNPSLALRLTKQEASRIQGAKASATAPKEPVQAPKAEVITPAATPAPKKPIANMDTGPGAGAGSESMQGLVNRLAKGVRMTPDEMARARKAMDEQGIYPD